MSNIEHDRAAHGTAAADHAPRVGDMNPSAPHDLLGPGGLSAMAQSQELLGLQMKAEPGGAPDDVQSIAAQGVAGSGGALPHGERIQAAFGRHDVSDVQAHVGGAAAQAASMMNAQAYATGREVAFARTPDLHLAAHEAAHVVQQQGGVSLKGGVGKPGDRHEQHADAVADAVVAGRSAEGLLDRYAGGGGAAVVQRRTEGEAPDGSAAPKLPDGLTEPDIEAAQTAAAGAQYDPDAVGQLQAALGVAVTGKYDRQTVIGVYQKQVAWKRAKRRGVTKGFASKHTFQRLGLIAYAEQKAGEVEDAELAALKDPAGPHAKGLTVAITTFYKKQSVNNQEIWKQADAFASAYHAVAVMGGKLVTGKAVRITEVSQVVEAIRAVYATVSAKSGAKDDKAKAAPAWSKIRNVALFAHGMHYGMSMDEGNSYSRGIHSHDARNAPSNVEAFAGAIEKTVHDDVNVQLFACNTGRDVEYLDAQRAKRTKQAKREKKPRWHAKVKDQLAKKGRSTTDAAIGRQKGTDDSTYREWTNHDGSRTGEGSFADEMADAFGPEATVYGHSTAGHTHANYAAKVFGKGSGSHDGGKHMFDVLYPSSFIESEVDRLAPGLPDAARAKAVSLVREEMWDHYRDSISAEHKRKPKDKDYDEPVGRGMFMDPAKTRGEVQQNWKTDWLASDGKSLEAALEALKGKPAAK